MSFWRLFAIVLLAPACAIAAGPSFQERFGGVKEWDFFYTYSSSSPYSWSEYGVSYSRQTLTQTQTGRVRLKSENFGTPLELEGFGQAAAGFYKSFRESSPYFTKTRRDGGSGRPEARVRVRLDLENGLYTLEVMPGYFKIRYDGVDTSFDRSHKYDGDEELQVFIPTLPTLDKGLPLPASGVVISGSYSFEEQIAVLRAEDASFNYAEWAKRSPITGTLKWVLMPAEPTDVKLIVEPQEYETFVPEAGKSEDDPGNAIAIKATLVDKKTGGAPKTQAATITFRLIDTSREPGIAINAPLKDARDGFDMEFTTPDHNGWQITEQAQTASSPYGPQTTATAKVRSFDFGGYSTLMVTATLTNGRIVVGEVGGTNDPTLRLPKRSPESAIADAWKQAIEFTGPDDADDDRQTGNDNLGDGLTAYEEYRGMLIKGVHTRKAKTLSPTMKDLVVENQLGDKARPGLKLFDSASGIRLLELEKGGLPESRQVNINFKTAHAGDQFGLRVVAGAGKGMAGYNHPAEQLRKTPRRSQAVVIDPDFAEASYKEQAAAARQAGIAMPYTAAEDLANTVAHEVAHGVGAPHHGKESDYLSRREITPRMTDWLVYDTNGNRLDPAAADGGSIKLNGSIGTAGNTASGDAGCIMCYTSAYNWAAVGPLGGPYHFYAVGLHPVGIRFCTSAKATGFNLAHAGPNGVELPGFFGDATSVGEGIPAGNCLGQMRVRDY